MKTLENILEQYYVAHQISVTVNILDIASADYIPRTTNLTRCACEFLQPEEGWNRFVTNSSSRTDKCYYCQQQLSKIYSNFNPCSKCDNCYLFLCKQYAAFNGGIRLTEKFVKKHRIK